MLLDVFSYTWLVCIIILYLWSSHFSTLNFPVRREEGTRIQDGSQGRHCCCCCCYVASVMSDSVWPHRRQPTRLPHPWDSPGKNTGVGCHFLLQCMKVKSESKDAQSCPTLSDLMDCSLPGSSVHGIFQARVLEWVAIAFSDQASKPLSVGNYQSLVLTFSVFYLEPHCPSLKSSSSIY